MLFVIRISNGFKEILIPLNADIFGRAGAFAAQTDRVVNSLFSQDDFFDHNGMLSAVPKIIFVLEFGFSPRPSLFNL